MTKKQRKRLAQQLAELEHIIQTSADRNEVRDAQERMMQMQEAADMNTEDMCAVDEMVQDILQTLTY